MRRRRCADSADARAGADARTDADGCAAAAGPADCAAGRSL